MQEEGAEGRRGGDDMQTFRTLVFIAGSVLVLAAIAFVIYLVVVQVIPGTPFSPNAPARDIPALPLTPGSTLP